MAEAYRQKDSRPKAIHSIEALRERLMDAAAFRAAQGRPFVVLSYAQSVDGSIAGRRRERIRLSGKGIPLTRGVRPLRLKAKRLGTHD